MSTLNNKTILICGGAGFIGSNFTRYILEKYPLAMVVNYDKLTYSGNVDNIREHSDNPRHIFIQGDVADEKQLSSVFVMYKPDYVINFAAESITETTYIPLHTSKGTTMLTFGELWEQQKKKHAVEKTERGEAIFLNHHNVKVLSFLNEGQWMPLRALTRHWYKGKIIRLIQKHGIVEATPNHSIYASNLELKNPTDNPEVLVLRNVNENNKKYRSVSKELLQFLAAFITEGSTTFNKANGSYITEISQADKKWLERIAGSGKKLFGITGNIAKNRSVYRLQFNNKKLFYYLKKECGTYAVNKQMPSFIFDLSPNLREFFWQKLLEGDGTNDGRYTTVSPKLANQLGLLLTLQNISYTVHERKFKNKKWKTAYSFRTGKNSHYGLSNKKQEIVEYDGWVYDAEVGLSHNFVCGIGNVVCHNTHVDRSIHVGAKEFILTNVLGVFNILERIKASGNVSKYVQVSTDEVYGSLELDSTERFHEKTRYTPSAPYAATKAGGDHLCNAYFKTWGVPVVVTHCSNNYGPYQYPEKLIPFFIVRMLEGKKLPIYGDGKHIRDWIYVLDHCRALELCLFEGLAGQKYHIGADNEINNLQIAELILQKFGRDSSWIEFVAERPGHDRRYAIDSTKIRMELGWEPLYNFQFAFDATVDWYLNNPTWIENVRQRTGVFNPHIDLWKIHEIKI